MLQEGQRQIPRRPVMDVSSMALVQQRIAARLPFAPLSGRLLMLQHHNYRVFALFSPQFKKCLLVLFTTNGQETMAKRVYCLQIRRITTIKEVIKYYFTTIEKPSILGNRRIYLISPEMNPTNHVPDSCTVPACLPQPVRNSVRSATNSAIDNDITILWNLL